MTDHLKGARACLTPIAAGLMYARQEAWEAQERLPWSEVWHETVISEYRRLRFGNRDEGYAGWTYDRAPDRQWDSAERIELESGRWSLKGNCNDFAPELKRRLIGRHVPKRCLGLVICKTSTSAPHLVLALHTSKGTAICCSVQGCWDYEDPQFRGYEWIALEGPDGAWVDLRTVNAGSLEDLLGSGDGDPVGFEPTADTRG